MIPSNGLRMPFAEWLWHMSVAKLSPSKRMVATYAGAFNITSNSDLERLTGLSEDTLRVIKQQLPKDGFICLEAGIGGRGHGLRVSPALNKTPLTFTDLSPKNPLRYYPPKSSETPREIPPLIQQTPGAFQGVCKKVSPTPPSKNNNTTNNLGVCDTRPRAKADAPHMNGVGFVISAKHDLIIPLETIEKWRVRFPSIPDLEAKIEGLAAHILAKGPFACPAGWEQPAAWMASLLADENVKAKALQDRGRGGSSQKSSSVAEHLRITAGLPK